jgi:hypothetical protein
MGKPAPVGTTNGKAPRVGSGVGVGVGSGIGLGVVMGVSSGVQASVWESVKVPQKSTPAMTNVTPSGTTSRKPPSKTKKSKTTLDPAILPKPPPILKAKTIASERTEDAKDGSKDNVFVTVDLHAMAKKAWRERFGEDIPNINPFGDSNGTVWTQGISEPGKPSMYTTTEYPPSVLDESFLSLPDQDGVAFKKQRSAKDAFRWWIICTVPSVSSRRTWANELLGDHTSVKLVVALYSKAWCTLLRNRTGSFCVEYNGRECVLG